MSTENTIRDLEALSMDGVKTYEVCSKCGGKEIATDERTYLYCVKCESRMILRVTQAELVDATLDEPRKDPLRPEWRTLVGVLASLWCEAQSTAKAYQNHVGEGRESHVTGACARMVAYESVAQRLGIYEAFKEALPL